MAKIVTFEHHQIHLQYLSNLPVPAVTERTNFGTPTTFFIATILDINSKSDKVYTYSIKSLINKVGQMQILQIIKPITKRSCFYFFIFIRCMNKQSIFNVYATCDITLSGKF